MSIVVYKCNIKSIILYKTYSCVVLYKMFTLLQIKYTYVKNSDLVLITQHIGKSSLHVNCNVGRRTCLIGGGGVERNHVGLKGDQRNSRVFNWVCERNHTISFPKCSPLP